MQASNHYNFYIMEKKNKEEILYQEKIILQEESLVMFLE